MITRHVNDAHEREMLQWAHVNRCACGRETRMPGRSGGRVFVCGRCKAEMETTNVEVRTDAEVTLILTHVHRWNEVKCLCGAQGRHHVRVRPEGDGGLFLHCRSCGEELMEVEV